MLTWASTYTACLEYLRCRSREGFTLTVNKSNNRTHEKKMHPKYDKKKLLKITVRIPALKQVHDVVADYYAEVNQVFVEVCKFLGIEEEKLWFGLKYQKYAKKFVWLKGRKKIALLQVPVGERHPQLEFGVRFYPTNFERQVSKLFLTIHPLIRMNGQRSASFAVLNFFYNQVLSDFAKNRYKFEIPAHVSTRLAALSLGIQPTNLTSKSSKLSRNHLNLLFYS